MTAPDSKQGAHELAASDQLRAVVDEQALTAVDSEGQSTGPSVYNITMGRLLADRIGARSVGPEEYMLELMYLCDDAQRGYDSHAQQAMPDSVRGYDSSYFVSTAIGYARAAFGGQFGDRLIELRFGGDYLDQIGRDRAALAELRQQNQAD